MKELKETEEPRQQESYTKKLELENTKLKETLQIYQTKEIMTNQVLFNQWIAEQIEKIKDGINQIMEALESLEESEEDIEDSREEELEKKRGRPKKESMFRKFRKYGDNLSKEIKMPDEILE